MKTSELIRTSRKLDECLSDIKLNRSSSFEWYSCKGVNGCLFEIGGRNKEGLELKLYIPNYDESGNPISHSNGFVDTKFGVDKYGFYLPNLNINSQKDIDVVELARTKDFRKFNPKYKVYTRSISEQICGELEN